MTTLRKMTAAGAIALMALSTVAAEGDVAPGLEVTATRAGHVVTVSGTATAGSVSEAQSVGGAISPHQDATVASQAGVNLTDALIQQTDDGLNFFWQVDNLHGPAIPEGVRYTWSFTIEGQSFQLQAKTTNLASVTTPDDPAGHVTNAGASFQVRGNCVADWSPVPGAPGAGIANCPHIGWADGAFDTANNQISMTIPWGFHELIQPGALLIAQDTAAMSIAASFQAVISNATTSASLNGWNSYSAGLVVFTKPGFADDDPAKMKGGSQVELAEDGSFTAEVEIESDEVLWVLACTGYTCTATIAA